MVHGDSERSAVGGLIVGAPVGLLSIDHRVGRVLAAKHLTQDHECTDTRTVRPRAKREERFIHIWRIPKIGYVCHAVNR